MRATETALLYRDKEIMSLHNCDLVLCASFVVSFLVFQDKVSLYNGLSCPVDQTGIINS